MVMTAACGVALSTGLIPALIYLLLALAPLVGSSINFELLQWSLGLFLAGLYLYVAHQHQPVLRFAEHNFVHLL